MPLSSDSIRFATFNASLNRNSAGQLVTDLSTPDNTQAKTVAEIIQRTNPDVVLINEFDYDSNQTAAELFRENYLSVGQNGVNPVEYPYFYTAPSNTGIPSGFDLNNNGAIGGGDDALGFGLFPGQFGMIIYSKYPIDTENVRTFQNFLWKDMPGALLPDQESTPQPQDWYSPEELAIFRLSSKSHWDVPIEFNGETIHVLASHPTPPVFDGAEDRNGRRNHDEIRFWSDYITPGAGSYIYDDAGNLGGIEPGSRYVVMGDQNADPLDGDSVNSAILQLLNNPLFNTSVTPSSDGGVDATARQGGANATHRSNPAFDTADFADTTPGNLRADYVLPSYNLAIESAQVFWQPKGDPLFPLVGDFNPTVPGGFPSSDHRLVWVDVAPVNLDRQTVSSIEFIGEVTFPTGFTYEGTQVGGLSGIAYDPVSQNYYSISDDRSQFNPARFYTIDIDLSDGALNSGDVTFTGVKTLLDANGNPFAALSVDPEGIALTGNGSIYISSEGEANPIAGRVGNPFVDEFDLATGVQLSALPVPDKFLPTLPFQDLNGDGAITNADQPFTPTVGIRNNLALESLTITPDRRYLYTATENALGQDGAAADLNVASPSRILKYDLTTGQVVGEFQYITDPVAAEPIPAGQFRTNGLVDLLALDNNGTLLSLERSFSTGVGNSVKLYEVQIREATDISSLNSLSGLEVDVVAEKRLLLDFADLGLTIDNLEGLTFGPQLPDGRQSLVVVSDNNFSATQSTQFLSFAIDIDTTSGVAAVVETPPVIDLDEPPNQQTPGDADDPAIYVNRLDAARSFVIATLKDGGLATYDLEGRVLQTILPGDPGDVRYNNVDLVYGFKLGNERVDLAIASDRENDTLAIYRIDPATRQLANATSIDIPASIFGIDDGEQTAYGLATYTSPVTGKSYVFVSQREGNQVAQLELVDDGSGAVDAQLVRTLTVPIPSGGVLEAQVEGMVADRELGYLYVGQENGGIFKFSAEPDGAATGSLIEAAQPEGEVLVADVEGLTIYYADNGTGYLLVSSQGNSTYAVYSREGDNEYLGSFAIPGANGIDSVEESDGADVINVPLGSQFPFGLLVVQDGNNDPAVAADDDGTIENVSSNFKFIPWQNVATAFPDFLKIDTTSYDPRTTTPTTLPNGIASGDTTQDSTVLWTRSTVLGEVTFEYSTDRNFDTIAGTVTATVANSLQPVKVEITGLQSRTDYYYRVTDAAGISLGGEFRTAAALGDRSGLRFGVSGDWRGELAPYPAISNAAGLNLDFFVEHGDTIYADYESPVLPGVDQVTTLEQYRLKHSEVYGDRLGQNTWADLRRSTSILATIDDHEVINDFAGGALASSDPRLGTASGLVNDTPLYENGLQAFQEYNPLRDEFYGATGDSRTSGERQLYRYNTYGSDAATFVLDNRSFRDQELPGVTNLADPAQVGAFLARSFDLDLATGQPTLRRTMLGQQQLSDLKADLLNAEQNGVTWKFVMVPEPIQNLGVVGASDRFEGYAAERTDLLKFIDDNDIDNVVFVAADIHGTVVNNLTYQLAPGQAQIATNAFEISTGSVAFDAPFGQSVADLAAQIGLLDPVTKAFYDALPIANDADSLVNDKDDFIKQITNAQLAPLGYDPIGLNANLGVANGQINATLLQGDYLATHTYGWSQFDIDPLTQKLVVTTYGIDYYTEAELQSPADILSRTPRIVSQFEVSPQTLSTLTGNSSANQITGGEGGDRINGLAGNDTIAGRLGNDELTGGGNNDTFVIRQGDNLDTITDFGGIGTGVNPSGATIAEVDTIRFRGEGLTARNLLLTQTGSDLVLNFEGVEQTQVILKNFSLEDLDNLQISTGAAVNLGNVLFTGQTRIQDSFDVFDANSQRTTVFNRNSVVFMNDLSNTVSGFGNSADVMNGQGGDDDLSGLSGNDLLRGGVGNDTLTGGEGRDRFILASSSGTDTITDFTRGQDLMQLTGGLTFAQLSITSGTGTNAGDTLVRVTSSNELLAIVTGIRANITSSSFVTV